MNPLASRKQLLLAESDLNRAAMVEDLTSLSHEIHSLANRARTMGSLAAAATSLIVGVAAFCRKKTPPVEEKPSWWRTILKGAGVAGSLWAEFRPQNRKHD